MTLPTLKIVVAWSDRRNLCSTIRNAVEELAGAHEVRPLGDDAFLVHTDLTAAELRDRLRALATDSEGILVAEFEVWSGEGQSLDAKWLLARGH